MVRRMPTFPPPWRVSLASALSAALLTACAHTGSPPPLAPPPAPAPARVPLRLLAINDFHGNLTPPEGSSGQIRVGAERVPAGGAAWLAQQLNALRASAPGASLMVSSGDLIGASPLVSSLFHDEPTLEAMNLMGLALNAVGNHEFDDGAAELLRLQTGGCHPQDGCQGKANFEGARFQFLAANVVDARGATLFAPYAVREFGGVKVAFIGLTLQGTPEIVDAAGIQGLRFLDEADTVNALVPGLQEQGVHAIVVLLHEGGVPAGGGINDCQGLSGPVLDIVRRMDPEVDVVLSAHTHQAYNCVLNGKRVTSAASYGRLVTSLDLRLDPKSGDVVDTQANNVLVTRDGPGDAAVGALVARYEALSAPLRRRVLGQVTAPLRKPDAATWPSGESSLGNFIADAQLEATRSAGAQVSFMNPGGIRAELDAGDVTYGEAISVEPFGNALVTLTLTGAQLHQLLEEQWGGDLDRILQPSRGFAYTWSASAPVGHKVDPASLRLDGAPVRPDASYRVTVSSFLAGGGDGFKTLLQATDRQGGPLDVTALESLLKMHSPLPPPSTDRITRAK
jgi:5'-nucleotidase